MYAAIKKITEIKRIESTCSRFKLNPLNVISVIKTEAWLIGKKSARNLAPPNDSAGKRVPEKIIITMNNIKYI